MDNYQINTQVVLISARGRMEFIDNIFSAKEVQKGFDISESV